jgi:hypothetical protein
MVDASHVNFNDISDPINYIYDPVRTDWPDGTGQGADHSEA